MDETKCVLNAIYILVNERIYWNCMVVIALAITIILSSEELNFCSLSYSSVVL